MGDLILNYRACGAECREDARVAASHSNRVHLLEEVKRIESQIEQLVDRIVSAQSQTVITAYENRLSSLEARKAEVAEMIENCGRPLIDFDTTHRTALEFLENPYLTWAYGSYEHKRAVLRMTFPTQLSYQRNHGFRTAEAAIPFRIFNDLGDLESDDSEMVPNEDSNSVGSPPVAPKADSNPIGLMQAHDIFRVFSEWSKILGASKVGRADPAGTIPQSKAKAKSTSSPQGKRGRKLRGAA